MPSLLPMTCFVTRHHPWSCTLERHIDQPSRFLGSRIGGVSFDASLELRDPQAGARGKSHHIIQVLQGLEAPCTACKIWIKA